MKNNNYIRHLPPYLTNNIAYDHDISYDISRRFFFYFIKILIFWVVREKKGQKIVQNEKKFWAQYLEKGDRKSYSD